MAMLPNFLRRSKTELLLALLSISLVSTLSLLCLYPVSTLPFPLDFLLTHIPKSNHRHQLDGRKQGSHLWEGHVMIDMPDLSWSSTQKNLLEIIDG